MAFEVSSVPLSETIIPGLPRRSISVVSSRATRRPEIVVSGIAARHSRHIINDIENPEPSPACKLVVHEIERPTGICFRLDQDRRTRADGPSSSLPLANRKPFLAIQPIDAVDARMALRPA